MRLQRKKMRMVNFSCSRAKVLICGQIKEEQGENDRLRRNAAVLQLQQIRLACDKNTTEQIVGEHELHAQALLWRLYEAIEQYNDSSEVYPAALALPHCLQ